MLFRFVKLFAFFLFSLLIFSCASVEQVHDDFYKGLLVLENDAEKVKLFESALISPNEYVRQAAADELAVLFSHGTKLSAKTMERVRKNVSPCWAAAFEAVELISAGNTSAKEKVLNYFLYIEQGITSAEARNYAAAELAKYPQFFNSSEMAAIDGHFAVFQIRYADALNSFRGFQIEEEDSGAKWPQQIPKMFFEYPNLINDLGRAFQYTASGNEGLVLFLNWEAELSDQFDDMRYRLLFYAARISRRIGSRQQAQSVTLFERALVLAPDAEQQDACIWYIIDLSLTGAINIIHDRLEKYVPLWHNGFSYNSVMERYLHRLVSARDWRRIIRTYALIKDVEIPVKSGFAYIIARSFEEGYLSAEDRRLAAQAVNEQAANAEIYMQIAYNASNFFVMPALYYRMKSAESLSLPFLDFTENPVNNNGEVSQTLEFLLGFFRYGAAHFSNSYIRFYERKLTPAEMQVLAHALEKEGIYTQSMRMVSLYVDRNDHNRNKRDLELLYPRPYLELIEEQSKEFSIAPPLFFSLVRTESAFQAAVVSRAGAVGLSQLMPATARDQAARIRREGGPNFFCSEDNIDSTNPVLNLYIGTYYLNYLRGRFNGDMYLALMAYNGGQNRVRRWRNASNLPLDLFLETVAIFETRDYGKRVTAIGKIYQELYYID